MIYIDPVCNPSGAYPNPKNQPFEGAIPLNDEEAAVFFRYNGFVLLTEDGVMPSTEAWEAWRAALPGEEPDPGLTVEERIAALEAPLKGACRYESENA